MAFPIIIPLAIGVAAIAAVALSGKGKGTAGTPVPGSVPGEGGEVFDSNMPIEFRSAAIEILQNAGTKYSGLDVERAAQLYYLNGYVKTSLLLTRRANEVYRKNGQPETATFPPQGLGGTQPPGSIPQPPIPGVPPGPVPPVPPIPGVPPIVGPPKAAPPVPPGGRPPNFGFPPPGGSPPIPGIPPGIIPPGIIPPGVIPPGGAPPIPPTPGVVAPESLGLPKGGFIDGTGVRYVLQQGDFGLKVAQKFGRGAGDVPEMVKDPGNAGRNWNKSFPGEDVKVPESWWTGPRALTTRPGPANPVGKAKINAASKKAALAVSPLTVSGHNHHPLKGNTPMSSYVVSGADGKPLTLYVHPPIVKVTFQRRGTKLLACGEIETYGNPIRLCASIDLAKGKALAIRLVKALAAKLAVAEKQGPAVAAGAVPDVPLLSRETLEKIARDLNGTAAKLSKMALLAKIEKAAEPLATPALAKAYGLPVVAIPGKVSERLLKAAAILHQRAVARDKRALAIVKAMKASPDAKAKAIFALIRRIHASSAATRASLPLTMGIGDSDAAGDDDGYSDNHYAIGDYYDAASGAYVSAGVAYDPETGDMYAEGAYPEEALVGFGDLMGSVPIRHSAARMASPRMAPPKRPGVPVRPGMRPPVKPGMRPPPGRPPVPVKPRASAPRGPLGAAMRSLLSRLFGAQRVAMVR